MSRKVAFKVRGLGALALSVFLIAFSTGGGQAAKQLAHQIMLIREEGSAAVVPGTQTVRPGDTVEFIALGDDFTMYLTHKEFFSLDKNTLEVIDKGSLTIEIMAAQLAAAPAEPGPEQDAYWRDLGLPMKVPYAAYSMKAHSFAEGHSTPVLLIEPPNGD